MEWEIFNNELDDCNCCNTPLKPDGWWKSSFSTGRTTADVMAIARNPGRQEEKQRRVLCGPGGRLFDTFLEHAGLNRVEVYCTNLAKCYSTDDRPPMTSDYKICTNKFLYKELLWVAPRIILVLGNDVMRFLVPGMKDKTAVHERGKVFFGKLNVGNWKGFIFITHHPGYVIRKMGEMFNQYMIDAAYFGMIAKLAMGKPLPDELVEEWEKSNEPVIEIGSRRSE